MGHDNSGAHADASHGTSLDPALLAVVAQTCVCRRVQRASRAVGKRFDDAMRPLHINNWQFTMLMAVARSRFPTVNQLAADLGMDRTTVTKNLGPLAQRGLVQIQPDAKDKRVRRVALTESGGSLLADAIERWRTVNEHLSGAFSPEGLDALMGGLATLAAQ